MTWIVLPNESVLPLEHVSGQQSLGSMNVHVILRWVLYTHTLTHTSYILMGYYLQVGFKHHALWGTPGIITWSCILNHIWQCSWSNLIKTCCYLPKFLLNNVSLHMKNTCWCASLVPCHVDTVGNIAWSKLHHEMYDSSHLIYMYLFLSCPA